jgi:aminoglycoside phosphotransferase (APT) family kinase protein
MPRSEEGSDYREPLSEWLASRLPSASGLRLSELRKPGAGESSDTQLFTATWVEQGAERRLDAVLRCAPSGDAPFPEYNLAMQFGIMRALGEHTDVPVPEVLWLEEDPSVLGVPFLTMKAVDGEVPLDFPPYHGGGIYRDASPTQRRHMWRSIIEALVRQHDADWRELGLDFVPGGAKDEDPATHTLGYWRYYLDDWIKDGSSEVVPLFDEALDWLEANRPEAQRIGLCWGDAKLGNVLFDRETHDVAAVIDWELATIGDTGADLASLRIADLRAQDGAGTCLDGTPDEQELVAMYEQVSGRRVEHFPYQLVFSAFWRASVGLKVMRRMKAQGADIDLDLFENHSTVRHLRELLARARQGS